MQFGQTLEKGIHNCVGEMVLGKLLANERTMKRIFMANNKKKTLSLFFCPEMLWNGQISADLILFFSLYSNVEQFIFWYRSFWLGKNMLTNE